MRMTMFLGLAVISGCVIAGCASPLEPESRCFRGETACAATTPVCPPSGAGLCTRTCTTSADCSDLVMQTSCDVEQGLCAQPCVSDSIDTYACVGGDRVYCDDDSTLTCDVCPSACDGDSYCAGTTCQPLRAAGEACSTNTECAGWVCTAAGRCSVEQGEACTDETCAGVCAEGRSGDTFCIRSSCPSDCESSTAGGFEWTCVRYETYQACVPRESCSWESACSSFIESTCGMSCNPGGGCWTYCVPNEISTDDD